jgi:hypothetical protein
MGLPSLSSLGPITTNSISEISTSTVSNGMGVVRPNHERSMVLDEGSSSLNLARLAAEVDAQVVNRVHFAVTYDVC